MNKENRVTQGPRGSLCETCTHGHIVRGHGESEMQALCTYGTPVRPLPFLVQRCTDYEDRRLPSLYSMEKIAMILLQETAGRRMGFVTIEQFYNIEGADAEVVPANCRPRKE